MKTLSVAIGVPLTVLAYNISMKMDARNIDQLINAVFIALIVLAVVIPSGLFILAEVRHRRMQAEFGDMRRRPSGRAPAPMPYHAQQPNWNSPPPLLTAQPPARNGSFAVQQPVYDFQQEDWQ